jgi:hypothetical protein
MTVNLVLNIIGWAFLVASWVVPMIIKKETTDKYFIGGALAAFACGIFLSTLVIHLMK